MINWKVRLHNKTWLLSMAVTVIAFVYQILALLDVVPAISEQETTQLVTLMINILAGLGIIIDPTTSGISDSQQALSYTEPRRD